MRKHRRSHQGGVFNPHPVVHFIFFFQAAQDGYAILYVGLSHVDRLKTAFQSGVFFYMFAVLVQGSCPHAAQFTPRQRRLEHIGRVNGPFRRPGAHQGMKLINKKDNFSLGFVDFL
ncbi:MAG: hypothetical protein BWY65_01028 [Firmicutes bacterium ADurb.Bin373]|nr:MAG: hypothetical protein BWY65_01028 [Firmicutes bacterium ADurb.Bin373]